MIKLLLIMVAATALTVGLICRSEDMSKQEAQIVYNALFAGSHSNVGF